jgi:hypothetical protein
MTRIEIPIRVRFQRIQTKWEICAVKGDSHHKAALYAFPTIPADYTVKELDPWKCRDAFFAIPENDNTKLGKFLDKVGVWLREDGELKGHWSDEVYRHYKDGNPQPISVEGLWRFRTSLKNALVDERARKELANDSALEFPLTFELTDVASGALGISDVHTMLIATVIFDAARGIRFKVCAREDCKRPFPLKTKRRKIFCNPYCAHITTVRRNRPKKGGEKRTKTAKIVA